MTVKAHCREVVLAVFACAAPALAGPAPDADFGPDLETYRALIEKYRSGSREEAVRVVGSWGPVWIEAVVDRFLRACKRSAGGGVESDVRTAQGAFLLHTHAALASHNLELRSADHEGHVEAALRLLRWVRRRYDRARGTWPAEAAGLSPRDFYLALASGELALGRHDRARDLAEESLWTQRRDGEMRLLAGCAEETEALIHRQVKGQWSDRTLRDAERRFSEALDNDPDLLEARLRLGWVLVRRGWPDRARTHLETVAETPGDDGRRALAWLFLGAVHEERKDSRARVDAYRRALALAPHLQAAHIGLAHALEEKGGDEAARAVLGPFFLERSRSWVREDPWNDYPFGPPELRLRPFGALLETLCPR